MVNLYENNGDDIMRLFHYYEKEIGPFISLSNLKIEEAENIINIIHNNKKLFASNRDETYLKRRFKYEDIVRKIFISKGGELIEEDHII